MKTKLLALIIALSGVVAMAQQTATIEWAKYNLNIKIITPENTEHYFEDSGSISFSGGFYGVFYVDDTYFDKKLTEANYKDVFKELTSTDIIKSQTLKNGLFVIEYYDEGGEYRYIGFIYKVGANLFVICQGLHYVDDEQNKSIMDVLNSISFTAPL